MAEKCMLVGYDDTNKHYKIYNPLTKQLFGKGDIIGMWDLMVEHLDQDFKPSRELRLWTPKKEKFQLEENAQLRSSMKEKKWILVVSPGL